MNYSDISPRTQVYADRRLLERAKNNNVVALFAQIRTIPKNSSLTIKFRRYNRLEPATVPLMEGVSPTGKTPTYTDITAILKQYGDFIQYTDVIQDTHEDPQLQEFTDLLGEQAADTYDLVHCGKLLAGTNVLYANGTQRSDVNTAVTKTILRRAERALRRAGAQTIKERITGGPNIGTFPIAASYIAFCHSDLKFDLEQLSDWTAVHQYASGNGVIPGELGTSGVFRFVEDNNLKAWADAGGAKGSMLSTSGTYADVYPILIVSKNSYGVVPLAGKNAAKTYIANPQATPTTPLAQIGTIGWKGYTEAAILYELGVLRLEVATTA